MMDAGQAALYLAVGLIWGGAVAFAAARLRARGVRVAYTRKVFHFGIFTGAALVHAQAGLPGTNAYAIAVVVLVVWAVSRGDGFPLYEALARESDAPRRTLFIIVPLVTTAVGGLASALLAGPFAAVGYLVAGWGDAVGEPAGARWGKHRYRVPSLAGVPAVRSWEGSLAVFVASWLAAATVLLTLSAGWPQAALAGGVIALVATFVEAVSPHGTDNFTVQLVPSLLALALARQGMF